MTTESVILPAAPSSPLGRSGTIANEVFLSSLLGASDITISLSLAALIFAGQLQPYIGIGIGMVLASCVVHNILGAIFSSYRGAILTVQDVPVTLLAQMAASAAAAVYATRTAEAVPGTVITLLCLSTLIAGISLYTMGRFRGGQIVRFIPYPVVSGFLAGTGWVLTVGSISVAASAPIEWSNLALLAEPSVLPLWLAGIGFGLVLAWFNHYVAGKFSLILSIALCFAIFYGAVVGCGISIAELRAHFWLLGPFPTERIWPPPIAIFEHIDWKIILAQAPQLLALIAMTGLGLLVDVSSLELVRKAPIDPNKELRSAGLINMVASVFGGFIGYHDLAFGTMIAKRGHPSRLIGVIMGFLALAALFLGLAPLTYVPTAIIGGLLFMLGVDLLIHWGIKSYFRLSRGDYAIVIMIAVSIALFGFLFGVVVGLAAAMVQFAVNYGRIGAVKYELSGFEFHSNVERSQLEHDQLIAAGQRILIFKLQGFLFFGSAYPLIARIQARYKELHDARSTVYVVLDFGLVRGIDSSAAAAFIQLSQFLEENRHMTLALTGLQETDLDALTRGGFEVGSTGIFLFDDIFDGVEYCEELLLGDIPNQAQAKPAPELAKSWPELSPIIGELELVSFANGEAVIEQGHAPDALFLLDQGRVRVVMRTTSGKAMRLRTLNAGTIVGEIGFYVGLNRSASVIAEGPVTAYKLTATLMAKLEATRPELMQLFYRLMMRLTAQRLNETNRLVQALLH